MATKPVVDTVKTAQALCEASAEPSRHLQAYLVSLRRLSALVGEARVHNDRAYPDMQRFIFTDADTSAVETSLHEALTRCADMTVEGEKLRKLLKQDTDALVRDVRPEVKE